MPLRLTFPRQAGVAAAKPMKNATTSESYARHPTRHPPPIMTSKIQQAEAAQHATQQTQQTAASQPPDGLVAIFGKVPAAGAGRAGCVCGAALPGAW